MKSLFKFSILFVVILFSCKRNDNEFIGPGYISAPEGFTVNSFSTTSPSFDLSAGPALFNADFTNAATYILTLTGQTSGAVQTITGTSDGFTNLEWSGTHSGVAFFKVGETVTATLSFYGTSYTASTTFTISQVADFSTCGQFVANAHFENPGLGSSWHPFNQPVPIPNVTQGVGSTIVDYKGNTVKAIQGNNYYYIRGKGNQANFVSGIQYDAGAFLTPVLPADPDNVWVNMYIYGTGDPNAQVELEYQEADVGDPKTPNTYDGKHDDAMVAKFTLEHVGWKLFSFQYSKLVPSSNALFGGSGNKVHEPHRLRSFGVVLVKKTIPDSPVEVYFDYPIITTGGPFKPCN